ncbi:MAG: hypothetical protein J2P48_21920, partial [Alphaproteobacteria bacterium]|nr:hypothetical protein [Alphaproteobacteria bacterium]
ALPLCRLPFELIWMEWPGSDPAYARFREDTVSELAPMPQRMGVLLQTDESTQAGIMTFAWLHRHAPFELPVARAGSRFPGR